MKEYKISKDKSFFSNTCYYKVSSDLPDFKDILDRIDEIFPTIPLVKNDMFVKAGILTLNNGQQFFIKKYEKRDFFYQLEYAFTKTRAEKFWSASLILEKENIFHPDVYGILIKRKLRLFDGAYLITEILEDTLDSDFLKEAFKTKDSRESFCKEIVELLHKVHRGGVFHGDAKLLNFFMVTDCGNKKLGIWDLDGAISYKNIPMFARCRDLGRLAASIIQLNFEIGIDICNNEFINMILTSYENFSGIKLNCCLYNKFTDKYLKRKGYTRAL